MKEPRTVEFDKHAPEISLRINPIDLLNCSHRSKHSVFAAGKLCLPLKKGNICISSKEFKHRRVSSKISIFLAFASFLEIFGLLLISLRIDDAFRNGKTTGPRTSGAILIGKLAGTSTAVGHYTNFYLNEKGNPGRRRHCG